MSDQVNTDDPPTQDENVELPTEAENTEKEGTQEINPVSAEETQPVENGEQDDVKEDDKPPEKADDATAEQEQIADTTDQTGVSEEKPAAETNDAAVEQEVVSDPQVVVDDSGEVNKEQNVEEQPEELKEASADEPKEVDESGDTKDDVVEAKDDTGEPIDDTGEQVDDTGGPVDDAGGTVDNAGEQVNDAGEPVEEKNQDTEDKPASDTDFKEVPPTTPQPPRVTMGTETDATSEKIEVDPHATSPQPNDKPGVPLDATATVKFVLMPSGQVATLACTLGQTLAQLKNHFASELKMPASLILLMFDGKNMEDKTTLADLGVGPNGTVQLEMQSADPVNTPIKAFRPRQEYHMPDVITVRVSQEAGKEFRDIVVEIERATRKKAYMGGYRHKKSGIEFHHASAQTMSKKHVDSGVEKFCRDTQTVQQRHHPQQTTEDTSTQMTKIGVYVANLTDKLVVPGKYTTAEQYHKKILEQVIIVQKYYRRWLAQRVVTKVRQDHQQRLEWERKEELRKRKEKEERIRKEFERRMNPKKKKVPTATLR